MLKKILPAFLVLLLFSCGSGDKDVHTYWINSYTVPCEGAALMQCLQFQKAEEMLHGEWVSMADHIEGFDYEPGYLYKLKVKEVALAKPAADGSSIKYELISIEDRMDDPILTINSIWEAEKINGEAFEVDRNNDIPRIEVNARAKSISGTDGCNFFNGSFAKLTSSEMQLAPMAQTKRACQGMDYADAFMQALGSANNFSVSADNQNLVLLSGDKIVLDFKRVQ